MSTFVLVINIDCVDYIANHDRSIVDTAHAPMHIKVFDALELYGVNVPRMDFLAQLNTDSIFNLTFRYNSTNLAELSHIILKPENISLFLCIYRL